MPPLSTDGEKTRPYFIRLRELQNWLAKRFPQTKWGELSMGTSSDFEVAIEEGATFVRIGTAILGQGRINRQFTGIVAIIRDKRGLE